MLRLKYLGSPLYGQEYSHHPHNKFTFHDKKTGKQTLYRKQTIDFTPPPDWAYRTSTRERVPLPFYRKGGREGFAQIPKPKKSEYLIRYTFGLSKPTDYVSQQMLDSWQIKPCQLHKSNNKINNPKIHA